ncbi:MAG TPA: group II intron reverse transcriptase/maturase [Polyangiaceae bacterium]|jgi:group II intron reverse transcriptase/maturase|nr:group II intron reverse transcriptase/maturase [Polyangiaceae bacterium]
MGETPSSQTVCTKLERIAKLAKQVPAPLTTLAHHIDIEWLREAHRLTRKDGARGVDGRSAEQYESDLEGNLGALLGRVKAGTYRAPPVRRVYIPKGDGQQRPLGIPTYEDKVLQRAVAMVLEAVYEQEFLDCSYGFRPGRSAHQALGALRDTVMEVKGAWVLEVDVQKYFDTIDHEHLRNVLCRRIGDGAILRLIGKWLNAGVMEGGEHRRTDSGTPQGGVISPMLANIFLHDVLDTWFERDVKPRLGGRAKLVRFADDFVIAFEREEDAHRVKEVLPKRFGKFGLTLHPEKTRLVRFQPPSDDRKDDDGDGGPGTFDLLGFTLYWAKSKRGYWVVQVKTAKSRVSRTLERLSDWCRLHRHLPVAVQWKQLTAKLRGHYAYFGIIGNAKALLAVNHALYRIWRAWLNRRSQRALVTWAKMHRLVQRYPLPRLPVLRSLRA